MKKLFTTEYWTKSKFIAKIFFLMFSDGHVVVCWLYLIEIGGLGETLGAGTLGLGEPGSELLQPGPVLGPVLDVLGIAVALLLGLGLQVRNVLGDPVQLVLVVLGVLGNLPKKKIFICYSSNLFIGNFFYCIFDFCKSWISEQQGDLDFTSTIVNYIDPRYMG